MSLSRLDHFAIEVNDIESFVRMLEETGGLRVIRWGARVSSGLRIAMLGDGTGMKIEVAEEPAATEPRLHHIAFRANDVEGACEDLEKDGWTVVFKPRPVAAAHAVSALLSNADGFNLQVIRYAPTSPDIVEWTENTNALA